LKAPIELTPTRLLRLSKNLPHGLEGTAPFPRLRRLNLHQNPAGTLHIRRLDNGLERNFKLEFAAEGVAREMLIDRKWPYRTFRVLKYHLSGFTDDELRKILVRAGGIRLTAGGQEVWGLLSRNREYLSVEEIKEAPTQIAFDSSSQQQKHQQQQQEGGPQDELTLSRDSSGAFERVRAEMIKLGTLECVRPAARQK
jgi:hypothetical protein